MICLVPFLDAEPLWLPQDYDEDDVPTDAFFEIKIVGQVVQWNSVCSSARLVGVFCYDLDRCHAGDNVVVVATNDSRDHLLGRLAEAAFAVLWGGFHCAVPCIVLEEPGNYWRLHPGQSTYDEQLCKEALTAGNFFDFSTQRLNDRSKWKLH